MLRLVKMARARNIKPGFFTNDELVEHPFEVRLLFIGLWTIADREGRLMDRPKKIRMEIFPADNVDCDSALEKLANSGFIKRFAVNGERFIQILNWNKHQNPHVKEQASTLPTPDMHQTCTVLAPELPEQAGLIPDSLNLIPETREKQAPKAARFDPRDLPMPFGLKAEKWGEWVGYRMKTGKALKPESWGKQVEFMADCIERGADPNAIIDNSIRNGYTGLFEPKQQSQATQKGQTRHERLAEHTSILTGQHRRQAADDQAIIHGTAERLD